MFAQLCHKALAECHDLSVGFSLRIEVGTTFSSADRKTCQRILEDLLETKELDNSQIYGRVKTQAAFVRSNRIIELHTVSCIHLYLSLVIYP